MTVLRQEYCLSTQALEHHIVLELMKDFLNL